MSDNILDFDEQVKIDEKNSQNSEKELDFEVKIQKAQELLDELVDPEITLSKSVEVYKKGLKELETAQKLLDDAKLEFTELSDK